MNCPFCKGLGFVAGGDTCPHCVDEGLNPIGLKPLEFVHIAENDKQPEPKIKPTKIAVWLSEITYERLQKVGVAYNMLPAEVIEVLSKRAELDLGDEDEQ